MFKSIFRRKSPAQNPYIPSAISDIIPTDNKPAAALCSTEARAVMDQIFMVETDPLTPLVEYVCGLRTYNDEAAREVSSYIFAMLTEGTINQTVVEAQKQEYNNKLRNSCGPKQVRIGALATNYALSAFNAYNGGNKHSLFVRNNIHYGKPKSSQLDN